MSSSQDLHMFMCLGKQIENMANREKCMAYLGQRMYAENKDTKVTLKDLASLCEKTESLPVSFFANLCTKSNDAMGQVWKGHEDKFLSK
jgi:hypothetical protein